MKFNNLKALEKHLESSATLQFAPLYMILSKDDFNRKLAYDKLLSHLLRNQTANPLSLRVFDEEKVNIDQVMQELESLGFFSTQRIVVIHHAENLLKAATEKLLAYYENPNPAVHLVLTATSITASTNFYKKSEMLGVILEIPEDKPWEKEKSLKEWGEQKISSSGKKIEPAANQLLLKQIGTDQSTLNQELEKLVCYVGDRDLITAHDIYSICISLNVENIWQLGEAIFRRDMVTALRIALALLQEGTPLLILLRQIRSQFQTDFQVCTILAQGGSGLEITKQFAYMKGQILEKHMHAAKNYGMQRFKKGMILIDESELAAKNGAGEASYLMERLIIKLVM